MVLSATEEFPYNNAYRQSSEHSAYPSTAKQLSRPGITESRYARNEIFTSFLERAKSTPFLSPFSQLSFNRPKNNNQFPYEISASSSNESLPSTISSLNSPTNMDMTSDVYCERSLTRGSFEVFSPDSAFYGSALPAGPNETPESYEYFSQRQDAQEALLPMPQGLYPSYPHYYSYAKKSQSPRSPPGMFLASGSPFSLDNDLDSIPFEAMKQRLSESMDHTARLNWRVEQLSKDNDMSRQTISALNNVLANKDIELRESRAQLTLVNLIRESAASRLLAKEKELASLRAHLGKDENSENLNTLAEELDGLGLDQENAGLSENKAATKTTGTMTEFKWDDAAVRETAHLVVECEDLKERLAKALQEAESHQIDVGVRDKEIASLKVELRSFAAAGSSNLAPFPADFASDFAARPYNPNLAINAHHVHPTQTIPDLAGTSPSNDNFSITDDDASLPSPGMAGSYRGGWGPEHRRGSISSLSSASFNRPPSINGGSFSSQQDYRRLVDKIVQQTDQQASIFLQQKLKTAPQEQKDAVFKAILAQAYPLMTNRFGNFLVQKCFESGTPAQVKTIASAMRGNVLVLACDPFGCHVVQKALDIVDEDLKATFVSELFRKIPDTITHRYACHVWQKIFELQWTCAPPAVMKYVNNALVGTWSSVALDETGSLVVQNIFENVPEADKRPIVEEVLSNIVPIAKGQWGNWVIQHLLEHGAPNVRAKVLQTILDEASAMSMDQFASKVVEKALRGGGIDVMTAYVKKVSQCVQDKPRCPLIDIASDQYGNYIIQNLLSNAPQDLRETIVKLIRRHMVSLRGSKYGQKVACMIEKGNDAGADSYHQSHPQRRGGNYSRRDNGY